MAQEKRLRAMAMLARDAGVKTVKAAKAHENRDMPEAAYQLLFAIAENTAVMASVMLEALLNTETEGKTDEQGV